MKEAEKVLTGLSGILYLLGILYLKSTGCFAISLVITPQRKKISYKTQALINLGVFMFQSLD